MCNCPSNENARAGFVWREIYSERIRLDVHNIIVAGWKDRVDALVLETTSLKQEVLDLRRQILNESI